MDTSFPALMGLFRDTVIDPRGGARRVLQERLPMNARWLLLALVVVLTALTGHLALRLAMGPTGMMGGVLGGPFTSLLLQGTVLFVMASTIHAVGRMMGGGGSFPDALLLVTFLQGLMLVVQVLQIAALLLLPPLAGILSLIGFGLFLWVLTGFVAELHGFRSLLGVLGMIVVTAFGVAFLLALMLAMLGFSPPAMG
jgi:hypothetical protein